MKKFSIICLIIIAITGIAGTALTIAGITSGATFPQVAHNFNIHYNGNFNFNNVSNSIENASNSIEKDDGTTYTFENFEDMNISLGAAKIQLQESNVTEPTVFIPDNINADVNVENNTLNIDCNGKIHTSDLNTITIEIPKDMALGKLDLEIGAGKAAIGPLSFTSYDVELGAGKLDLNLEGAKENYNYSLDIAAGKVKLGDESFSGLAFEKNIKNSDTATPVDIECAAGKANINFVQ